MKRKIQILLAWCENFEAISALRGFHVQENGANVSAETVIIQEKQHAVQTRVPYIDAPMSLELLPTEVVSYGENVLNSIPAEVRSRYTTVLIDLNRVISFQKTVSLGGDDDRFSAVEADNLDALCKLCLPLTQVEEDLTGTFDSDGKGITLTSLNPNLRVGPIQSTPLPGSNNIKLVGFPVLFGSTYMHVVEYKGRYFLKDGYHRAYGLLKRGITRAPVLLQRGRTFNDVHNGHSSSVSHEHLFGTHPPMLTDFLDDTVSATVEQQAFRKVARIHAEEFVINL